MSRMSSTKTRISKRALSAFPEPVSAAIQAYADDLNLKSLTFIVVDPAHSWWVGEGERYTLIYGEEQQAAEVVAEHNIGAAGVIHAIGTTFTAPVGAWVLQVYYYGKFFLNVYNVQTDQLTESESTAEELVSMTTESQRVISIRNVDVPAIGTMGWATKAHGFDDTTSPSYGAYLFQPDGETTDYYQSGDDPYFVPDDFQPGTALAAAIEQLAVERQKVAAREEAYKSLKRTLDEQLKPYADARSAAATAEKTVYDEVALFARAAYLMSGDRKPDPDVELKREVSVQYDLLNAIKWAIAEGRIDLLKLDDRAFEKAAKDGKVPDAVAIVKEGIKPYIGSNLAHRIPAATEQPE